MSSMKVTSSMRGNVTYAVPRQSVIPGRVRKSGPSALVSPRYGKSSITKNVIYDGGRHLCAAVTYTRPPGVWIPGARARVLRTSLRSGNGAQRDCSAHVIYEKK